MPKPGMPETAAKEGSRLARAVARYGEDGCASAAPGSLPYSAASATPRYHCTNADPHEYYAEYQSRNDPCNSCDYNCTGNCALEQ